MGEGRGRGEEDSKERGREEKWEYWKRGEVYRKRESGKKGVDGKR